MTRTLIRTGFFASAILALIIASIFWTGCHYQLPPAQPRNHRFPTQTKMAQPPARLDFDAARRYTAREYIRQYSIPTRSRVLRTIVASGKDRVAPIVRTSALALLAYRRDGNAVDSILQWKAERHLPQPDIDFSLVMIDARRFPVAALCDSFFRGTSRNTDTISLAENLARLGDPSFFAVIQRNILAEKSEADRVDAVHALWYFWPYQDQEVPGSISNGVAALGSQMRIDLFPLLQAALMDSSRRVFTAAIRQYDYAPRHPQLQRDLEQVLAQNDEFRAHAAMSVLVYRYHRKERDFPRDIRSYCSRRKRTPMD